MKRKHVPHDQEIDTRSFGSCCACGQHSGVVGPVRTLVMLDRLSPTPGRGWACLVCGLGADGAIAVVCDSCTEKMNARGEAWMEELSYACRGFPDADGRIPIAELHGSHKHDMSKHPEVEAGR